jgi:hypothetical protein
MCGFATVSVPKAAMHEDSFMATSKDNIWIAR